MSKRGKDLFYLLEQREQGGRSEEPQVRTRPARPTTSGLGASLRQWFGARMGAASPTRSGKRKAAESAPTAPFGLIIAAVALLALGVGFALGRFLPRAEVSPQLVTRPEGAPRRPGPVQDQQVVKPGELAPGQLANEKEEESLSKRWFRLLTYSASQRATAAQAAAYLRGNGVDTARIFNGKVAADGRAVWAVVAYAVAPDTTATLLAKLKAVPSSDKWSGLNPRLDGLTARDLEERQ